MRDPDLVQRAERAAMALERAWGNWRVMHGLGSDPLPPVSSYVGYSLEEPWGQPRVVFGVSAEEAERLAALIAGHDCYGPVHAELSARPDWRLAASGGPATAQGRQFDGGVSVPVQAPPPGAEPVAERDAWHGTAAADTEEDDGEPAGVGWYQAAPTALDSAMPGGYLPGLDEAELPGSPASPMPAESASPLPTASVLGPDTLDPLPADPHEPRWLSGVPDGGDSGQGQRDSGRPYSDERGAAGRPGSIPPPAEFWLHGEPAGTVELAAVEQASVISFRRRPGQPAGEWQEQTLAPPNSDSYDAVPSQGPGYCGPRYQGFPPQYQPGPGQPDPPELFGPRPEDASEPSGADQSEVAESGDEELAASESSASKPEVAQSGDEEPEAVQSGDEEPEAVKSGDEARAASGPSAGRAKTAPSEVAPSEVAPSETAPSEVAESEVAQSQTGQSEVVQSQAGQSAVRQSRTGQSRTAQSRTGQSRTGQSRTVQSGGQAKAGQSRAVQSKTVQSKTVQSKTVQSKTVQSKTVQPKAGQSKTAQSRQTSPAGSPGRASAREAGKRPRGQ